LQRDALTEAGCEKIFIEQMSGAVTDRPALREALEYARSGDTLIVWKLDRLARSMKQLIETIEGLRLRGIGFRSLTEAIDTTTAQGVLVLVAGALTQEAIDIAVILNALRALSPGGARNRTAMPVAAAQALRHDHERLEASLDRLRQIADALDDADATTAVKYVAEANRIVTKAGVIWAEPISEPSQEPSHVQNLAMSAAHCEKTIAVGKNITHPQCAGGGHLRERRLGVCCREAMARYAPFESA
jgi:hypothetical protein